MTEDDSQLLEKCLKKFEYKGGNLVYRYAYGSEPAGRIAGGKDARGYRRVRVGTRLIQVHRVVFLMHHKYLPEVVDHVDCDPTNNNINNLRAATRSQNIWNSKLRRDSKSGEKGVYLDCVSRRWRAGVTANKKFYRLGSFVDKDDAVAAVKTKREELHKEFARHA